MLFTSVFWTGLGIFGIYWTGVLAYVKCITYLDEEKIKEKFNTPITVTQNLEDYIERSDVERDLRAILTPTRKVNEYIVIFGEGGTGKTSSIQKVCKELGQGIIYVNLSGSAQYFNQSFAQSMNVRYHQQINGGNAYIHKKVFGPEKGNI